jgi:putative phosphoesterase
MILFVSDIHGRLKRAERFASLAERLDPEQIVFLGDYLYNGPRNGVPDDYDPLQVSAILNRFKDKSIGIRGNCDSRIDGDLLAFPLEDNRRISLAGLHFDLYHGDAFSLKNLHPEAGDVLVSGHTHIYVLKKESGFIYLNPGSISFPKNGNPPTYAVFDGKKFEIRGFDDDRVLSSLTLDQ